MVEDIVSVVIASSSLLVAILVAVLSYISFKDKKRESAIKYFEEEKSKIHMSTKIISEKSKEFQALLGLYKIFEWDIANYRGPSCDEMEENENNEEHEDSNQDYHEDLENKVLQKMDDDYRKKIIENNKDNTVEDVMESILNLFKKQNIKVFVKSYLKDCKNSSNYLLHYFSKKISKKVLILLFLELNIHKEITTLLEQYKTNEEELGKKVKRKEEIMSIENGDVIDFNPYEDAWDEEAKLNKFLSIFLANNNEVLKAGLDL